MFKFKASVAFIVSLTLVSGSPNYKDILTRASPIQSYVNQMTCNGETYTYQQLAGYGFIPSNARDKFGDTIGGIGSSIALDKTKWRKTANGSYTGVIWTLPDRGWYDRSLFLSNRSL